jgi:hypothetical protein
VRNQSTKFFRVLGGTRYAEDVPCNVPFVTTAIERCVQVGAQLTSMTISHCIWDIINSTSQESFQMFHHIWDIVDSRSRELIQMSDNIWEIVDLRKRELMQML